MSKEPDNELRRQIEDLANEAIDNHYKCDGGPESAHIIADEVISLFESYVDAKIKEAIGEDFVFDRPLDDYLPAFLTWVKAKNELRAEQRQRAGLNPTNIKREEG